jgi:hypothetical protein
MANEAAAVAQVVLDDSYYMEHPDEFEKLTEAEQNQLLVNGVVTQGDTEAAKPAADDSSGAPAADADGSLKDDKGSAEVDEAAKKAALEQAAAAEGKPEGIQSKDGKHIIPYSELESVRESEGKLKQDLALRDRELAEKTALIEQLTAAKAQDDKDGGTKAQDALVAGLREEYPELADKMLPVIGLLVEKGIKDAVGVIEDKLKPLQSTVEESAVDKHFNTIRDAHSDYDELMKTTKVDDWIKTQPAIIRGRYEEILAKGNSSEVIELVSIYKDANKVATTQQTKEQLEAAARAEAEAAKKGSKAPASLTDIPASSGAVVDEVTALVEMDPLALMKKLEGKTPAQIEEIMNKVV